MSSLRGKQIAVLVAAVLLATVLANFVMTNKPEPPKITGFDDAVTPITGPRRLLVVLMEFSDEPAQLSALDLRDQIVNPDPGLSDYFRETSYDNFYFTHWGHWEWVTSWDDPDTTEDESTLAYWDSFDDPLSGGVQIGHGLVSLDKHGYDFAQHDLNDNGEIKMGEELAYLVILTRPDDRRGGATRSLPDLELDGKTIEGRGCWVSESSPWITLYAHELGHQALKLPDYYAIEPQSIERFTLMGNSGTSGWAGPVGPHHLDPYTKLKLGWYSPTVVASDGFYDIPDAETNPTAYILHDPDHGTHEYFMVENRWKGDSYDNSDELFPALVDPWPAANAAQDIPDQGLLIWHIDETREWNGFDSGGIPKVKLARRGGSYSTAAFNGDDPDNYNYFDVSSPERSNWNEGEDSKIGVWCVSDASSNMRAWLDVPGPGVLPCPVIDHVSAIPGDEAQFEVKLTNTGDYTDDFIVYITDLDSDLTQSASIKTGIGTKATVTATVGVTPDKECTTSPGTRALTLRAQSMTYPLIYTDISVVLDVLPFGDPQVYITPYHEETEPDNTVVYSVEIVNEGNVLDTFSLEFVGADFGSEYMAIPTEIPQSWISFGASSPWAFACDSITTTLSISVPWDWAGMEDALYEFAVNAWSSITPDYGYNFGELLVLATPLSMMFYVKAEIEQLLDDVDALPPSDVRDGLHDKAVAALNKVTQGLDRYLLDDDPPSSNHFSTTQNILQAFIHLLHAQSGKQLTVAQATDFEEQVNLIIEHLDMILAEM